jgi:CubicO group peptidase (beta-lactamase class C family)
MAKGTSDSMQYCLKQNSMVCRWRPGERFAYSNPGYVILGYLIEKYSGKPYDQYLDDIILRPLAMTANQF